jgi:hypothetical protein
VYVKTRSKFSKKIIYVTCDLFFKCAACFAIPIIHLHLHHKYSLSPLIFADGSCKSMQPAFHTCPASCMCSSCRSLIIETVYELGVWCSHLIYLNKAVTVLKLKRDFFLLFVQFRGPGRAHHASRQRLLKPHNQCSQCYPIALWLRS